MLIPVEEFIEKSNQAQSVDELVQVLLDAAKQHGLDKMIFCLLSDHAQIGLNAGVGYLRNYPDDWMQYYFEQGFDKIDPVISYCYQKMGTFTWQEMSTEMSLEPAQKKCLNLGMEAGLHNGICTPLWGPHRFAGVGFASTEKKDSFDGNLDLITAYCNHFYLAFQRLCAGEYSNFSNLDNVHLTPHQREVLLWMSRSKSDSEIGEIMGISDHTVNYHIRNIYKKLNVNQRIVACTKAISLGLIIP